MTHTKRLRNSMPAVVILIVMQVKIFIIMSMRSRQVRIMCAIILAQGGRKMMLGGGGTMVGGGLTPYLARVWNYT